MVRETGTPERRPLALDEIAARIVAHLRRFEGDRLINEPLKGQQLEGLTPYYQPTAGRSGRYVVVRYVNYHTQGTALTRQEAEAYLAWLDQGNVGKDHDVHRRTTAPRQAGGDAKSGS